MRPLTDAEMFGTEEAKPLTDAEMFGAPEIKPLTDSEMFSAPEGEKVSKQEQFAIRTVPDAARSELRAPKPLEGVTRALKGMAGVPVAAVSGAYDALANKTPQQITQVMRVTEDLTGANIFGNMPEQLQIQGQRDQGDTSKLSEAERMSFKGGGAVGQALQSMSMGPLKAALAYGGLQAADTYEQGRDQGRSRIQALIPAIPDGVLNAII